MVLERVLRGSLGEGFRGIPREGSEEFLGLVLKGRLFDRASRLRGQSGGALGIFFNLKKKN